MHMRLLTDRWLSLAALLWSFAVALVISSVVHAGPQGSGVRPSVNAPKAGHVDPNHPLFEFAPEDGTGMGAVCSCATPTDKSGTAITFTRASSGTCLKGNTLTGIENGDLVTCTTNQARVMPGGDGTGGLGLLVEGARTNNTPRSQEFDHAAWTSDQSGVAAPVVTANVATAPDGTLTADRLQVPATTGSQYSQIYQGSGCVTASATSASIFLKAHNGASAGTLDLCIQNPGTFCKACPFNPTTWTRCTLSGGVESVIIIGSNAVYGAGSGALGAAADVDLWGAQCEDAASSSSYIPTTTVAVTRALDVATFDVGSSINRTGSAAATIVSANNSLSAASLISVAGTSLTYLSIGQLTSGQAYIFDGTTIVNTTAGSNFASPHRFWSSWNAADAFSMTATNDTDSKTASGAFDGDMQGGTTTVSLGGENSGAGWVYGTIKRVCIDTSTTRCR